MSRLVTCSKVTQVTGWQRTGLKVYQQTTNNNNQLAIHSWGSLDGAQFARRWALTVAADVHMRYVWVCPVVTPHLHQNDLNEKLKRVSPDLMLCAHLRACRFAPDWKFFYLKLSLMKSFVASIKGSSQILWQGPGHKCRCQFRDSHRRLPWCRPESTWREGGRCKHIFLTISAPGIKPRER